MRRGSPESAANTSLPPLFGDIRTTANDRSKSALKSWAFKMIRIEVILPGAFDSEHTSYIVLMLTLLYSSSNKKEN